MVISPSPMESSCGPGPIFLAFFGFLERFDVLTTLLGCVSFLANDKSAVDKPTSGSAPAQVIQKSYSKPYNGM